MRNLAVTRPARSRLGESVNDSTTSFTRDFGAEGVVRADGAAPDGFDGFAGPVGAVAVPRLLGIPGGGGPDGAAPGRGGGGGGRLVVVVALPVVPPGAVEAVVVVGDPVLNRYSQTPASGALS